MALNLVVRAADLGTIDTSLLVLALPSTGSAGLDEALSPLDRRVGGVLRRAIDRRDFRGGRDELLHLTSATPGVERLLLVGLGKATDRASALRRAAALAGRQAG